MQAGYDVSFYEDVAGIRPDDTGYGFKVIRFEPLFTSYMPWAKASIESPYGTVLSSWKNEGGKFYWQITIPANSTGLVALPNRKNITVNGKPINFKKFPSAIGNNDTTFYHFPSGNFNILAL
jgi:alpha-L-rhamnosidase